MQKRYFGFEIFESKIKAKKRKNENKDIHPYFLRYSKRVKFEKSQFSHIFLKIYF